MAWSKQRLTKLTRLLEKARMRRTVRKGRKVRVLGKVAFAELLGIHGAAYSAMLRLRLPMSEQAIPAAAKLLRRSHAEVAAMRSAHAQKVLPRHQPRYNYVRDRLVTATQLRAMAKIAQGHKKGMLLSQLLTRRYHRRKK